MQPLILLNTVGLTSRHLHHAPRLKALAEFGWSRPLQEVVPTVTCTAQATILTGKTATAHGVVGNGWLYRDTGEVRFWQQSNRLIQAEPLYTTAKRRAMEKGEQFRCAKLFWWFNQGADVDFSVTPKPHYGSDGNKAFDILGTPIGLDESLKNALGDFPFPSFWGPTAGLPATTWIAKCAAEVLNGTVNRSHLSGRPPELTLVYLPHLDYDTQRQGPDQCDWKKIAGELDRACEPILDAAKALGACVWVVNECTHVPVKRALFPNRLLRQAGMLVARPGPFGERIDTFVSRAFAVCDHQLAHVYVKDTADLDTVRRVLLETKGVARVLGAEEQRDIGLAHDRVGDLVALAEPDTWFAYPFWLDDKQAPDYARTVDIHRKPGYDPCELFFDPHRFWSKGRAVRRIMQKKLGFRTLVDVVPLDTGLVKGSHGLPVANEEDKPVIIGDGDTPPDGAMPMTDVRDWVLRRMGLR